MASTSKEQWQQGTLGPAVRRNPERQHFETTSGIELDTLYAPEDLGSFDYQRDLGYPGEYPFTRGVQATMFRGRLWTMRQYAGFASAEESNRRFRYLLEQGQTGLSIAFDLPTQLGYDSDHPFARSEVGKVGVPIANLRDMEIVLDSIPLDKVSTSMTINATAPILLAYYIAVAKRQGIPLDKLNGTVQNDLLKEYVARGTYIYPPAGSLRLTTDIFAYCSREVPNWNTISISGYHMREAGCTAAQEVAFTLADGIAYVQAALDAGLDIDAFGPRLSFFFASHNNLLEEVAKFRLARRLWARIMRERFGAKDPRSWMLRFHTQTAGCALTAQQPEVDVVRVAIQALAGVLGGTQSLHTNSFDEALALPSEEAVRIALRTQQVLAYESGAADVVDPLAGSYYLERLTNELEAKVQEYLNTIEDMGGALVAIERGYPQREIQEASFSYQQAIEEEQQIVVGVNRFTQDEQPFDNILRVDEEAARLQIARLEEIRRNRDDARLHAALARLEAVARSTENTMPAILECVEAYGTTGEIANVLRKVFGEQKELVVF